MKDRPTLVASERTIEEAKQDSRVGNKWMEAVCEAGLNRWLTLRKHPDFRWIRDDARYAPDFFIDGFRCDIVVLPHHGPAEEDRLVELPKYRTLVSRAKEFYFFVWYQPKERRVWLLGGISHGRFLKKATLDTEKNVYTLPIKELSDPDSLLYQTCLRKIFNAVEVVDSEDEVTYNNDAVPRMSGNGSTGTTKPSWG